MAVALQNYVMSSMVTPPRTPQFQIKAEPYDQHSETPKNCENVQQQPVIKTEPVEDFENHHQYVPSHYQQTNYFQQVSNGSSNFGNPLGTLQTRFGQQSPPHMATTPRPELPVTPESPSMRTTPNPSGSESPGITSDGYQDLGTPKKNQNKPKTFKCRMCDFVATTKEDSWIHLKTHLKPEKMLCCPRCPFVTEYKHHLEYHLLNHDGSKPFICPECEYMCVNKSMLRSHLKSHSQIYQYRCRDCDYVSKYCHTFKIHLRKYRHEPRPVLNPDGTEDHTKIIDVYGSRRGPRKRTVSIDGIQNPLTINNLRPLQLQNSIQAQLQNNLQLQTSTNLTSQNLTAQSFAHQSFTSQNLLHQNLASQNFIAQNLASQNLLSQNLVSQSFNPQNLSSQNLASQNFTSQNLASQNLSSQNLSPQNLATQNLPQNLSARSLSPQNLSGQNTSPQNLSSRSVSPEAQCKSAQNLSTQNLSAQNLSTQNLSAQNLSAQNLSAQNLSSQNVSPQNLSAQTLAPLAVQKMLSEDTSAAFQQQIPNPLFNPFLMNSMVLAQFMNLQRFVAELRNRTVESTTTIESENNNDDYTCNVCGISFKTETLFDIHMEYHDPDDSLRCKTCGKTSDSGEEFFIHLTREKH